VLEVARESKEWLDQQSGVSVEIYDTAGRQEIDEPLVAELKRLRDHLKPQEVLLGLRRRHRPAGSERGGTFSRRARTDGHHLDQA